MPVLQAIPEAVERGFQYGFVSVLPYHQFGCVLSVSASMLDRWLLIPVWTIPSGIPVQVIWPVRQLKRRS